MNSGLLRPLHGFAMTEVLRGLAMTVGVQTSLRGATLVATWQSRKMIRNGLLQPLHGLAMTGVLRGFAMMSYRHKRHCKEPL